MADCSACKGHTPKPENVPYLVYEGAQARNERSVKRLVCLLLVVIFLWACTIGAFMLYLNQYDFAGYEYTQDGEGVNIIGDKNGVDYKYVPTIEDATTETQ